MIKDLGGRLRSERTPEEYTEILKKEIANLSPEEKETLMALLGEMSDPALQSTQQAALSGAPVRIMDALSESEYLRPMVDIRTFVKDPYYLGATCDNLYPRLLDDMVELFEGGYKEAVLTGCVSHDTIIQSDNGSLNTLGEMIGKSPRVSSLMDGDGLLHSSCSVVKDSGFKSVLKVTAANGMEVVLTPEHRIRVWGEEGFEWRDASSIEEGDLIVCARRMRTTPDSTISIEEAKLLAYWCTDGCSDDYRGRFVDGNPETSKEVVKLLADVGFSGEVSERGNCWEVNVRNANTSGFVSWLRVHQGDKKTKDVVVPDCVCRSSNSVLSAFINRVWAAEGCVYAPPSGKSPPRFVLAMTSERFVRQIQLLLLRFGINARINPVIWRDKRRGVDSHGWNLAVSGRDNLVRFLEEIGPILGKEGACDRIAAYCDMVSGTTNVDTLPITWGEMNDMMVQEGLVRSRGDEWLKLGTARSRRLSRDMFRRWLERYGDTALAIKLKKEMSEDISFEPVKSIEKLVVQIPTGDVCDVKIGHRFVSNGICTENSIGWGKTYFASIAIIRCIYEISCLREPHRSFGIAKDTNISFVALSISEALAIKVVFENIATKLKQSPYFQEHFNFEETKKELRFPHKVWVAPRASTDTSALGLNVFGAILDEGNFMDKRQGAGAGNAAFGNRDKAQFLYDQIVRRMKSRFMKGGKMPGMMIVVSSKRTKEDFTAKRIRDAKDDPDVFVRDYALWDPRPENYSKSKFNVLVGNETTPSKILEAKEVEATKIKIKDSDGLIIIDVPDEFRRDFESDLENSIRDIAGVETVSISPFLGQRDKIESCIEKGLKSRVHPFSVESWDQSKSGAFVWERFASRAKIRDGAETFEGWQPTFFPGVTRFAHIDPSISNDATGFCVGCVCDYKSVIRRNEHGEQYAETAPVIWIDFMLRIVPPIGGEIDYGMVRGLVYQLQAHGFNIGYISMDQFNSTSSLQKFATKGIEADRVSVDRPMDAYDTLKSALYEKRLIMYEYEPLLRELRSLQKDNIKNKVDHPRQGSKDVADSMAGVVYSLHTKYRGQPMGLMKGISKHNDPIVDEQREMVETDDFFMPFVSG